MYTNSEIEKIVEAQRAFFLSGATLDIGWRIDKLKKLKMAVICNREKLEQALFEDLGRAPMEAYFCDIGSLILEINETIKGLKKWARPETHFSGFHCFPSIITKVYKVPYGVSLIISPFNFPVILSFGVLAAAIAGGNTAVIKASSKSPACTKALKEIISETFSEEYITLIDGGHDVADMCLAQRFDKIFYTGSPRVGVHVLQEAAKNLTSTALELGGETGNWCIIRKDANLKDAARKIAFFKALNSGQICININQIAVANEVAEEFIEELKQAFINQLGENATLNEEYPHLINEAAYNKCASMAEDYKEKIIFGGFGDKETLKYSPTILYPIDINEKIVQRELFCPLLPIVPYNDSQIDNLLDTISKREKGLSLYVFTKDIAWAKNVMQKMQFGGGCINEVCLHMMVKGVPFNGVGHSGMGAYHGKWGFMEFTHPQTVLIGSTIFNLAMREHPYSPRKRKLVEFFER
ncbi:aldehyde dehydrogenase (NAD+) [Pseudobutyrivibrio sp. OR37]|uniref:aldehyde dehydrogenase family protein n=1 Tax=Pseudobutyrivibrio sp. OR37 TaxID=1798186 RepID=UPI0008EB0AC7|nr:aldehyde dehydrogenase family protein [Pseudobutyrivibrio sp. OR37]SFI15505.1 aldehyde dehydrogenase (NAD+) [Pseudobutyrivibrio sp. OR37]